MPTPKPLTEVFSFVTGAIRRAELIYAIATDDAATKPEEAHLFLMAWHRGQWIQAGGRPWPAVAVDVVTRPSAQFMALGPLGEVVASAPDGTTDENIPPAKQRGTMRALRVVDGEAYAAGMDRQVYHRSSPNVWRALDTPEMRPGHDEVKGFEAVDGFSAREIYVAGWDGEIWWFDGIAWHAVNSPTNVILTALTCAGDAYAYAAGREGLLLRGRKDQWEILEQPGFIDDLWSLRWFNGRLYLSGLRGVYELRDREVVPIDFGQDWPKSTYHLSSCPEGLVSFGRKDILLFDTKDWHRIA